MKKAFMLVAAIALLAAPVFAEVEVTISGEATTSFGFNLDTSVYGMLSEVSSNVELVVGTLDGESMGEGNWYGVITLEGAGLTIGNDYEDGDMVIPVYEYDDEVDPATFTLDSYKKFAVVIPDVTAKITNGNAYVQLQSEADFDADYVAGVDNDPMEFTAADTKGSLTVGATFAPVTFAAEFGMAGSYEDADQVDGVAFGLNLGVDLAPITVDVAYAGAYGYLATQDTGFAVQVVADLAPVTVTAAFDGIVNGGFSWESSVGVALALDPITVGLDGYIAAGDIDTKLTVGYAADMFTADAFFGLYDLTATIGWETGIDLTVTPVSGIAFAAGWAFDSASIMSAYANVAFTELVDNVTFTLGWENADDMLGNSADDTDFGQIFVSAGIAF
ncbi:hypothetical protein [Spirochaeta isovalerica]|uniref:Porin domain-containing protein n=1 Tax=Spirochaeta isovalerica TaxID=150 RepID=A0A841R758_9SPIO|nr:hypothetical protein [Spirochaeta isovalerica]MBB6481074.1 hypothetical protein [Spirochaeta isovalerica]